MANNNEPSILKSEDAPLTELELHNLIKKIYFYVWWNEETKPTASDRALIEAHAGAHERYLSNRLLIMAFIASLLGSFLGSLILSIS
jgi:hypothetical protein